MSNLQVLVHSAHGGTLAAASATRKRLEAHDAPHASRRRRQTLLDYAGRAFELLAEGESPVSADPGALASTHSVGSPMASSS